MAHESPFTDWVYAGWDELVLDKGEKLSAEERKAGWQALFAKTFVNGEWRVPLTDAALVSSCGWSILMQEKSFMEARDLSRKFLVAADAIAFQEKGTHEALEYWGAFENEAFADVLCGNVQDGLGKLRRILADAPPKTSMKNSIRNTFLSVLWELGYDNSPDPCIAEFVGELVGTYPGCTRVAGRTASAKTNKELEKILTKTYGRRAPA